MVAPIPRQECADPKVTKWIDLLRGILNPVVTKLGKPGFSPLALTANWSNATGTSRATSIGLVDPIEVAGYSIDSNQVVRVRGSVVLLATPAVGLVIATLPAGFRPRAILGFPGVSLGGFDAATDFFSLAVFPNGDITIRTAVDNVEPLPLDSISFVAEQ